MEKQTKICMYPTPRAIRAVGALQWAPRGVQRVQLKLQILSGKGTNNANSGTDANNSTRVQCAKLEVQVLSEKDDEFVRWGLVQRLEHQLALPAANAATAPLVGTVRVDTSGIGTLRCSNVGSAVLADSDAGMGQGRAHSLWTAAHRAGVGTC